MNKILTPYTLGLDIGMASVGAALLDNTRIRALHVRTFDKAETAKEGDPLNKTRREARLTRRRIRRRAFRLLRLCRLFKRHGLISEARPEAFAQTETTPWQLRAEGLDKLLTPTQWAAVLYHIVKHRGFQSTRKSEAKEDEKAGQMLSGVGNNKKLRDEKEYRTVGEMAAKDAAFAEAKRNKGGDYSHTFGRRELEEELKLLFNHQRSFGNPHASAEIETAVNDLLLARRPALAGDALLKMVGKCPFETTEFRAPKASYSAERFVWLTKLNNLRISGLGEVRELNAGERQILVELPFTLAKLTYKQVRDKLSLAEHDKFNSVNYRVEKDKDPETATLFEAKAFHALRKEYKDAGLESEWQRDALNAERLDTIAYALTCYKEDDDSRKYLTEQKIESDIIEAVLEKSFSEFVSLSLKALRKILPFMEQGQRYDQAVISARYKHHSDLNKNNNKNKYLPAPDKNQIRNPVVYRALNQARKMINAIVREYGPPTAIHIELARDLSKPMDERRKIEKEQKAFQDDKIRARDNFIEQFEFEPKGLDLHKYRLYREQASQCAYSQKAIDINRLYEPGYAEIDHALPYSRSYDDGQNNKVLALTAENRNKGNRTPYEYLDGASNSDRWQQFEAWVLSNKLIRKAKRDRLLRKNFGNDEANEFRERNLNDTRYICREFKRMVETHFQWHKEAEGNERCVVVSGQLTSLLRARWGLIKVRENGDLHHALDAAVIAAASRSLVKRMADYSRRKELQQVRDRYIDPATGEVLNLDGLRKMEEHFPEPWPHFRVELEARLKIDNIELLRAEIRKLGTYSEEALQALRPPFVSRAPQRRNSGAAHMDTIYTKPKVGHVLIVSDKKLKKTTLAGNEISMRPATDEEKNSMAIGRIDVASKDTAGNYKLTLEKLNDIVDPARNAWMIESLRQWISSREEREKKAKAIEATFGRGTEKRNPTESESRELELLRKLPRKPLKADPKAGPFSGPIIRSVKVNAGKLSGIQIRQGLAAQESLLRVDVFTKERKFYLVPLYVADSIKWPLPDRTADGETQIDTSFDFCFSLHPNDLAKVTLKGKGSIIGYFRGYGGPPNPSNITLALHDRNKNRHDRANEKGEIPSIGVKTALSIEKFNVDILGNLFLVKKETRQPIYRSKKKKA